MSPHHAELQTPVGMLVGAGSLPIEIARSIMRRGGRVHAVLIAGEADQDWSGIPHTVVGWGSIGGMVAALKQGGCREIVIIGRVRRPDLGQLRPDLGFFLAVPRLIGMISAGGDDSLLRICVRFFEHHGLTVRGPAEVAPDLVAGLDTLGAISPRPAAEKDIALGFAVVQALGPFDIGQAVVVADGRLVAVEGAEGTDGLIGRLAAGSGRGGVLVKCPKPGQELRVDMPVIGPQTVTLASEKGLQGIAVAAGSVLIADRDELIRRADAADVFVTGVADTGAAPRSRARNQASGSQSPFDGRSQRLVAIGACLPRPADLADAVRGSQVVQQVSAFAADASAFVARRHVLAVGIGEDAAAFASRLRRLRQWGDKGRWRRRGIIAFADDRRLDAAALAAIAEARIAGIVVQRPPRDPARLIVAADRLGLTVLVPSPQPGGQERLPAEGAKSEAAMEGKVLTTERPTTIFVVAGEHSGDLLGGKLMAALNARLGHDVRWVGVGGEQMAEQGLASLFPLAEVAVMGPLSILRRLPRIVSRVYRTVRLAVDTRPDAVIIVDSPEFTHPIAARIHRRLPQVPIIDYVSPSVWAWRPGRARRMERYIDHVMALLPFEPEAHRRLGGPPCTYVGHPLIERLDWINNHDPVAFARRVGLDPDRPVLAVLPGSRPSEVARLMEPFGGAVALLKAKLPDLQFVIPAVTSVRPLIEDKLKGWGIKPVIVEGESDKYALFRLARAALAASGTVALELSLAGVPMVIAYRVDAVAIRLRFLVKVQSIVLSNLILGENAFPELIQDEANPAGLAAALEPLLGDTPERAAQLAALARIPDRMALPSGLTPSGAAAEIVMRYLPSERRP